MKPLFFPFALSLSLAVPLAAQGPPTLPDALGRAVVQRVCGATCHGAEVVAGKGYSRDNWTAVVNGMVSRGAKATPEELGEIVEYLAANLPPRSGTAGAGGLGFIGAGPDDAHIVDLEAAQRGQHIYVQECVTCHGSKARGGEGPPSQQGADLVRSLVVLKDRYGSMIGAFLKAGHPMQSGKPSSSIDGAAAIDLAHFLHLKVMDTLRSGPYSSPINVLTGDAKAGQAYFAGAGGCTSCHSATGDLKGVGVKYDPVTLQQKFLFPRTLGFGRRGRGSFTPPKPTTVEVTSPGGQTVSGTLVHLDDFNVSLRDSSGDYHTWKRTPSLQVKKNDPYQGHIDLLDKYTDKNIHDVVAYLETLK